MNGTGKGSHMTDAIVIALFITFLIGGGFYAWRAVIDLSALDFGKSDLTVELQKWEKSVTNKIESLIDRMDPKTKESAKPADPAAVPSVSGSKETVRKAEIKTIKFYEAGKEIPAVKSRSYATQFTRQARMIYVEISYKNNNYKVTDATLPVILQYYDPSGRMMTELKAAAQPKKDWASAIYTRGWGPVEGTPWQAGTYTVKVILDGEAAGEAKFDIL
jgi:hypothetical protein